MACTTCGGGSFNGAGSYNSGAVSSAPIAASNIGKMPDLSGLKSTPQAPPLPAPVLNTPIQTAYKR